MTKVDRSQGLVRRLWAGSQAISAAGDAGQVGQALMDFAAQAGVDVARLLLFGDEIDGSPTTLEMCEGWTVDNRPAQPYGTRLPLSSYPLLEFMRADQPAVVQDVSADSRANDTVRTFMAIAGVKSFFIIPLCAGPARLPSQSASGTGQKWLGALFLGRNTPSVFADDLVESSWTLAGQAAAALQYLRRMEELQATLQRLAQRDAEQSALIDTIPDGIYFKDAESRFTRVNPHQAETLGAPSTEAAVGKTDRDFYAAEFAEQAWADERRLIESKQPLIGRIEKVIRPDGQEQWVSATKILLTDDKGKVTGLVGISRDITELKAAQEQAQRRATELQLAAEISKATTGVLDPEQLIQQAVELIADRFGLYYAGLFLVDDTGEWAVLRAGTGKAGQSMLHARHRLPVGGRSMIGQCVANARAGIALDVGAEPVHFDNPLLPETRSELALPLISRGRAIGGLTIQSTAEAAFSEEDITALQTMADQLANAIENARLFQELQATLQRLARRDAEQNALIDGIPDGIYFKDAESRFTRINSYQANVLGIPSPEAAVGKTDRDFFSGEFAEQAWADERRIIESKQPLIGQIERTIRPDGEERWVSATKILLTDDKGEVTGLVGISRDITELKAAQEQAQRQATQMQLAAEISKATTGVLDPEQLIQQAVNLIADRFGLYYAGLFLVDDTGEWAVLRAGTGKAGRSMLQSGHRLPVGGRSMIGQCVANAKAGIALDVGAEPVHFDNPLLPETRSELALPLISRGRAIGGLTIQSTAEAAFSEGDIAALQTMADQLGNAIENARLFQERERRIQEMATVTEIGQTVASELDMETLSETVHRQVSRLFDVSSFYIASYEEGSDEWETAFHVELGERRPKARYSIQRGITGYMIRTRQPLVFSTSQENLDFAKAHDIEIIGEPAVSWLGVPLIAADKCVGVMCVQNYDRENLYSDHDLVVFSTIAGQVAVAVDNARLLAETQGRAGELAVLNEMGRTLTGMLDLDAVVDSIRHFASRLVDTTNFFVALYDAEQDMISFPLYVDGVDTQVNMAARRAGKGMSEQVIRTRQPFLVKEDLPKAQAELGIESIGEPAQSWLGVPMMVGEQPIGLIAVQSYTTPRVYDEHDRDLLLAVASQAAIAIQNARLFGEQQRTAGMLGERLKQLDCLSDIGRRAQEAPPLPEFLEWVAERIPAAMRYPDVCLAAVEFEGHLYGTPDAALGNHVSPAEGELPPSRLPGPADELSVPRQMVQSLRIGDEMVGRVYVTYPEAREFADEESALLGDVVRRVSGYIENRRLLEETEQASRRLGDERAVLRTLIDSLPDPTFIKDQNSRYVVSNVAHLQILGAGSQEEIVGETDFDRFSPELAAGFYADEQEIMRTGQPLINREEYILDEKGDRQWLWTTKVPLRDEQGRVTGLVGINRDITERKLAEESLRESESRLSAILDSIQTGVVIIDPETHTIVDVNPIAANLIGAPREAMVGARCHKYICPAEVGRCPITDLGQTVDNSERVLLTASGERRAVIKTVSRIMLSGREHLLESFTDISARKRAEEVLQRRGAQLASLSDIGQRIGEAQPAPEFLQWVAERIPAAFQYPEMCLAAIEFEGTTYGAAEALQQPRQVVQSLRRGREIVGRICVAYREERDFLDEESALLGDMARRVSGYIENQRLFEQTQAALAEVEATHRRYLQTQWQSYLRQRAELQPAAFMYDRSGATEVSPKLEGQGGVRAVPDLWRPEMAQALDTAAPAMTHPERSGGGGDEGDGGERSGTSQGAGLAVPVVLRGQTIGVLGIEDPNASQHWSDEEIALLEEVGDQLALALENARLFEETQRRAERERLITNITARIRSSTDMLGVLETTATELGKALGTSRVLVRLAPEGLAQAAGEGDTPREDGENGV